MERFRAAEEGIALVAQWLRLAVEAAGVGIVCVGAAVGLLLLLRSALSRGPIDFTAIRLVFGRYLALALEFQLAADIISTAVAPSWQEIGKLGAIAVIRTALNSFLTREIEQERDEVARQGQDPLHERAKGEGARVS